MSEWDNLEDDALASSVRYSECGVLRLLVLVEEDHGLPARESLERALGNVRLTAPSIRKALESRLSPSELPSVVTIQRHRTGSCSCRREAR